MIQVLVFNGQKYLIEICRKENQDDVESSLERRKIEKRKKVNKMSTISREITVGVLQEVRDAANEIYERLRDLEIAVKGDVEEYCPSPKFKVGDRVLTNGNHPCGGEEGTVVKHEGNFVYVTADRCPYCVRDGGMKLLDSNLTLLKDRPPPLTKQLKVRDYIRVNNPDSKFCGCDGFIVGGWESGGWEVVFPYLTGDGIVTFKDSDLIKIEEKKGGKEGEVQKTVDGRGGNTVHGRQEERR